MVTSTCTTDSSILANVRTADTGTGGNANGVGTYAVANKARPVVMRKINMDDYIRNRLENLSTTEKDTRRHDQTLTRLSELESKGLTDYYEGLKTAGVHKLPDGGYSILQSMGSTWGLSNLEPPEDAEKTFQTTQYKERRKSEGI
jgi:hypothetical protein